MIFRHRTSQECFDKVVPCGFPLAARRYLEGGPEVIRHFTIATFAAVLLAVAAVSNTVADDRAEPDATAVSTITDELDDAADDPSTGSDSADSIAAHLLPVSVISDPTVPEPGVPDLDSSFDDYVYGGHPDEQYLVIDPVPYQPQLGVRLGVWGVNSSGDKYGVGEYQGLDEVAPFYDIQGIRSDGWRTFDFGITGTENEMNQVDLYYFRGPNFSADIDYDRFIHRFSHPPLGGLPDADGFPPPTGFFDPVLSDGDNSPEQPGYPMFGEDFNAGQDYAIRVQTFDAKFKGQLTENISWGLNVWGMHKEGTRRANAQQHCFQASTADGGTSSTCHVVSQGQQIDWLTMEIEPVITARFGWLTAQYSRTMRKFQQSDELVLNDFSSFRPPYGFQSTGAYAYVPENFTEIDRLKLHGQLTSTTEAYVVGHVGNTHNSFRESDRRFYGVDARLMDYSYDGLSVTVYGKFFSQENSADTVALNDRYPSQANLWLEDVPPQEIYGDDPYYLGLADRTFWRAGVKGRWRPFHDDCGNLNRLAVTAGYEYRGIDRTNVTYFLDNLPAFTQQNTRTNQFFVGLQHDLTYRLNAYVRYRFVDTRFPLVGVTHRHQLSLDAAINSNLPEHEDRIEIGGNWNPTDNFLVNASFWIQNTYNRSDFVNFDEDSYPLMLSAWYRHDHRWSFSAGYANFSNWIAQDITLGRENGEFIPGPRGGQELTAWTDTWRYGGTADVINIGGVFAATCDLRFTGGFEYVHGRNVITSIPANTYSEITIPERTVTYPEIQEVTRVEVDTYRITAGVDYVLTSNISTFFRYNFMDYDDQAMPWNAGMAHMFLGGVNAVY